MSTKKPEKPIEVAETPAVADGIDLAELVDNYHEREASRREESLQLEMRKEDALTKRLRGIKGNSRSGNHREAVEALLDHIGSDEVRAAFEPHWLRNG